MSRDLPLILHNYFMALNFNDIVDDALNENANIAGPGGVMGTPQSQPTNLIGDSGWNPNDNRLAQGMGFTTRFGKPFSTKKNKSKNKSKKKRKS